MSTSPEKSNATMMPVPDANMVSDSKDKQVVNLLEAVVKEAMLAQELVEVKRQNEEIMQKRKEQDNQKATVAEKKCLQEADVEKKRLEAQKEADEEATKRKEGGLVLPSLRLVVSETAC